MKDEEFQALCENHQIPVSDDYVPPSAEELKHLLKSYDLTASQAGRLAGVSPKQMRKYTGGLNKLPYSVLYTLQAKLKNISLSKQDGFN